ncbi:MAG: ABC transporter permease subunit [Planctomycetota bacterium]|nr:ABC transporter permease subunit [Planctomycetota bacterium]
MTAIPKIVLVTLILLVVLLPVIGFYVEAAASRRADDAPPSAATFFRSIALAGGAAGLAWVLGLSVALAIARLDSRFSRVLPFLALVPLALPPTIQGYAWLNLPGAADLSLFGLRASEAAGGWGIGWLPWGGALILGSSLWPIVALLGAAALLAGSGSLEQAAAPYAGERRIFWRITLPGLLPATLAGAGIVYWLALSNYSVPSLLAMRTLSTRIFESVSIGTRCGEAAMGSLVLLLAAAPPLIGLGLLMRRRPRLSIGTPSEGMKLRRGRPFVVTGSVIAVCLGAGVPIISLAIQAGGLPAFGRALALGGGPLWNSARLAAVAATLAVGLGLFAAVLLPRHGLARRATWAAGLVSFVLPGYLLGRGLTFIYNRPGPLRAIYEGWPILALGIGAAFFLPAFATLGAAHAGLRTSLEEAAIASGAGPLRRLFRISLPLMIRDVAAIWLILFTLAFGEAGAAILREPPGFQTAQVLLFNQMHYGRNKDVAALCLLAMAISLIPLATAVCLWRRDKGTLT